MGEFDDYSDTAWFRPSVLFVSDQHLSFLDLIQGLERSNIDLTYTCCGQHLSRRVIPTPSPHLILLDEKLSDTNSYDLCRIISHGEPKENKIPIIFVTLKHANSEDIVRGFSAGGRDFIHADYKLIEAISRINAHLRWRWHEELSLNNSNSTNPLRKNRVLATIASEYIKNNLSEPLTGAQLARLLGITQRHLALIFEHNYGMTPRDYVRNTRIVQAKKLLKINNGTSISKISELTGFSTPANFSTAFKFLTGISPKNYR